MGIPGLLAALEPYGTRQVLPKLTIQDAPPKTPNLPEPAAAGDRIAGPGASSSTLAHPASSLPPVASADTQHRVAVVDGPALVYHALAIAQGKWHGARGHAQRQRELREDASSCGSRREGAGAGAGAGAPHHSCTVCTTTPGGIADRAVAPPYAMVAAATHAWLDALGRFGVRVGALVFDGALPGRKRDERLARQTKKVKQLVNFRATWSNDAALNGGKRKHEEQGTSQGMAVDVFEPEDFTDEDLFYRSFHAQSVSLPPPPLLVAAVLEQLRDGPYAGIVTMVPGEADPYCAAHARRHGGMVFTGDSDLLAFDMGDNACVCLFKDVDYIGEAHGENLRLVKYETTKIAQRFGLRSLTPLAYAVRCDKHRSRTANLNLAKAVEQRVSTDYDYFKVEYSLDDKDMEVTTRYFSPEICRSLQNLDTTISELVVPLVGIGEADVQDGGRAVYLPVMAEDSHRASPWALSIEVRQVAYSLLFQYSLAQRHRNPSDDGDDVSVPVHTATEHWRKGPQIGKIALQIYDIENLTSQLSTVIEQLQSTIATLTSSSSTPTTWRALSIPLLCQALTADSKPVPDRPMLRAAYQSGLAAFASWDTLHCSAQLQATVYSWRMLWQSVLFCQAAGMGEHGLMRAVEEAWRVLDAVPGMRLTEMCDAVELGDAELGRVNAIIDAAFRDLDVQEEAPQEEMSAKKRRKEERRAKKKKKKQENAPQKALGTRSNPFELLSMD